LREDRGDMYAIQLTRRHNGTGDAHFIARTRSCYLRRVKEDFRATGEREGTLFYCLKVAALPFTGISFYSYELS
jgi:hypothetical protein